MKLHLVIERIRYAKETFTVAEGRAEATPDEPLSPQVPQTSFAIVGALGSVEPNDLIEAEGAFTSHNRYGLQFQVTRAVPVVGGTIQSLSAFLTKMPGVGPTTARAIIQHFKSDRKEILRVMAEEPSRLAEVPRLNVERAQAIHEAYLAAGELRETQEWLVGLFVSDAVIAAAFEAWGSDTRARLREDPYALMELRGIGFVKADEIALSRFRIYPQDPRRAAAATLYLLEQAEAEGHTWTALYDLVGHPPLQGL